MIVLESYLEPVKHYASMVEFCEIVAKVITARRSHKPYAQPIKITTGEIMKKPFFEVLQLLQDDGIKADLVLIQK